MTRAGFSIILTAILGSVSPVPGEEPLSDRVVSYEIQAVLDAPNRTVRAEEWITFRNFSERSLNRLVFHLYPNAFSNTHTLYMRESVKGSDLRAKQEALRRGTWGYIQVDAIETADGTDLSPATEIRETLMEVSLPKPLDPGDSIRLRIGFQTHLPRTVARMGYRGEHFDVMQWFPKLAALVDGKWNEHEFHADSEFFADFGTYDVTISLESRFVLEATGEPIEDRIDPGTGIRTVRYRAEDVHDFAWIADPNFRVARETYRGVEILYLHQPYHARLVPRILAATRTCLDFYAEHFMEYPYSRLVIDDLPMGMGGGMEYPMLFTITVNWAYPLFVRSPEEVTIHEFGHQFWYGILASNEFEEPWLDEGINSYVSSLVEDEHWPPRGKGPTLPTLFRFASGRILHDGLDLALGPYRFGLTDLYGFPFSPFRQPSLLGFRISPNALDMDGFPRPTLLDARESYGGAEATDPIAAPSWEYLPGSYAPTVNNKTLLMMKTLERMVGKETLLSAIRQYVDRYRFRHPRGPDLVEILQEESGTDLSGFFDQILYDSRTVDFSIAGAESALISAPTGYLPASRVGDAIVDRRETDTDPDSGESIYRSEVIVFRNGEARLPVELEMRFEDGFVLRESWDGEERWKRFVVERNSPLLAAVVDPDEIHLLDLNRNNNSWKSDSNWKTVAKLSTIGMFWMQNLLHLVAALS